MLFGDPVAAKWTAAWRCDLHPAWDRSHSWLALNGRPHGGPRQVLIAYTLFGGCVLVVQRPILMRHATSISRC